MLEIVSNGSKWHGEKPDSIEKLLDILANHPLDKEMFDNNFYYPVTKNNLLHPSKHPQLIGTTHFRGNFIDVSHVFNIFTDEPEIIEVLTIAINDNLNWPWE